LKEGNCIIKTSLLESFLNRLKSVDNYLTHHIILNQFSNYYRRNGISVHLLRPKALYIGTRDTISSVVAVNNVVRVCACVCLCMSV
jgi:hypothetical protein